METAADTEPTGNLPEFEDQTKVVAQRVRTSLAELVDSVGADPAHSQNMARRFGLNKNLTWKISKVICEADPFAALQHLPGRSGINIFLESLARAGASEREIDSARAAMAEFDRLVDTHSDDRELFEVIMGSLASEGQHQKGEAHRKLAFRGNCAIWGVQAKAQISTHFVVPNGDSDELDLVRLSGLCELRRLRANVPWTVSTIVRICEDGVLQAPKGEFEPLDPAFAGEGVAPLMADFCSQPLPKVRVVPGRGGMLRHEIVEGPVGNTAGVTCIDGWINHRFSSRYDDENKALSGHSASLTTPAELLILDVFIRRDLGISVSREPLLCSELPGGPDYTPADPGCALLPIHERVQELGSPPLLITPEIPQYNQMVHAVLGRLGQDAKDFLGYRLKMRYPPIPTLATICVELPKRS